MTTSITEPGVAVGEKVTVFVNDLAADVTGEVVDVYVSCGEPAVAIRIGKDRIFHQAVRLVKRAVAR